MDTRPCCPQWEVRGTLPHNTAVWVGSITENIFRWWYSTCKHLKCESVYYVTVKAPNIQPAGFAWGKNLTYSNSLKLAVTIEFLVSLLCRLSPVCKIRTLNNQTSILAIEEDFYTQLHQSITWYETQTDSPNVCLFKQAHSQAKIISKVIHQPNPDSLTQTTMSANTDGAIHCSEGNTDLICQDPKKINSHVVENE